MAETMPMQVQHVLFQGNSIRIGNSTLWLKCLNFMSRGHILKCHFYGKVEGQTLNLYWSKEKRAGSLSKGLSQESSHGGTTDQMRAEVTTEAVSHSCYFLWVLSLISLSPCPQGLSEEECQSLATVITVWVRG